MEDFEGDMDGMLFYKKEAMQYAAPFWGFGAKSYM